MIVVHGFAVEMASQSPRRRPWLLGHRRLHWVRSCWLHEVQVLGLIFGVIIPGEHRDFVRFRRPVRSIDAKCVMIIEKTMLSAIPPDDDELLQ